MSWYVVKTKARQEYRAIANLENQAFRVYCPWLTRKDGAREALFAGYVFIELNQFVKSYASVRSTRGVLTVVRFGEHWASVEDDVIEYLKYNEQNYQKVPLFHPNQEVVIKEGPLKGLEAVYLCSSGDERAMVLLTIMHRKQTVKVEEKILTAI